MHKSLFTITIFLFVLNATKIEAQKKIQEVDYIVEYLDHAIKIDFDGASKTNVRAFDAFTNAEVPLQHNTTNSSYSFTNVAPGQILKLEYTNDNSVTKTNYIATESASTGAMNVYFNHPVNTAYSQGSGRCGFSCYIIGFGY